MYGFVCHTDTAAATTPVATKATAPASLGDMSTQLSKRFLSHIATIA